MDERQRNFAAKDPCRRREKKCGTVLRTERSDWEWPPSPTVVARMLGVFMKSTITKRSVVIGGHKTSVSLEDPFWSAVRDIAGAQEMSVSSLLRQIDLARRNSNLSSAIRVFVLENLRTQQSAITHNGTTNRHDSVPCRADLGPA
jgi:predicted DNA-binding ribbon-helix-helix protein